MFPAPWTARWARPWQEACLTSSLTYAQCTLSGDWQTSLTSIWCGTTLRAIGIQRISSQLQLFSTFEITATTATWHKFVYCIKYAIIPLNAVVRQMQQMQVKLAGELCMSSRQPDHVGVKISLKQALPQCLQPSVSLVSYVSYVSHLDHRF